MSIIALDKKTVKFLTTAQVVTSVATAVKELVENAIDARANSIKIKLVDNGASLIEVNDDGTGITEPDTRFMALQSYTSKIKNFADLDFLESYGFRGEALSCLCRMADLTVVTKTKDEEAARSYTVNRDGGIESFELCHRSIGTTIRAKSLFKDLPVRRQIMTSSKRSSREIKDIVRSFAICQPKIRISLHIDGVDVLTKTPTETPRETLSSLFGNKFVSQMEFVEKKMSGVVIKLTIPRKDAMDFDEICQVGQHVFINQRPVFYKEIEKVVNKRLVEYFGEKIPPRKKLAYLLSLDVRSSELDVNLEPNKTSVLLTNQEKIIEMLDEALMKFYEIPTRSKDAAAASSENTVNMDTISEYHDSHEAPSPKKPRLEIKGGKGATRVSGNAPTNYSNEENCSTSKFDTQKAPTKTSGLGANEEIPETISQLPVVDLGEDFSTREISNLPNFDPDQVEAILKNAGKPSNKNSNAGTSMATGNLTMEAWSKGQVPINLCGGTSVRVYGNVIENEKKVKVRETAEPDSSSTGCKGFLKFSKEIEPLITRENPGINVVEVAKSLTVRWKELSPEERGYYRDLGAADAIQLEKHDTSQGSTRSQRQEKKQQARVTSEITKKNRKRFLDMLENMKNPKNGSRQDGLTRKNVVPWNIDMRSVRKKFLDGRSGARGKKNIILGPVNENLWLARTGFQIWALSLEQLFQGLRLEKANSIEITRDYLEELFERWLGEKDGMSLLHPVFDLG